MRVKTGFARKRSHKKILKLAKGYRMTKSRLFKVANEAVLHAGDYAFSGRKKKKRDFKKLWIIRINAGARKNGLSYSKLVKLLSREKVDLNKKILAHLAQKEPKVFDQIVKNVNK
jgi:large subunit ribosomal protein L20